MEKITVMICTGTTCFVMGAGNLLELKEHLSEEVAQKVEIVGSNCLDMCKEEQYGKAPFVKVNEKLICEATVPKVIEEVNRQAKL